MFGKLTHRDAPHCVAAQNTDVHKEKLLCFSTLMRGWPNHILPTLLWQESLSVYWNGLTAWHSDCDFSEKESLAVEAW